MEVSHQHHHPPEPIGVVTEQIQYLDPSRQQVVVEVVVSTLLHKDQETQVDLAVVELEMEVLLILVGTGNTPPVSPSQGNNGGTGLDSGSDNLAAGGGGGAGGAGGDGSSPNAGGAGGAGSPIAIETATAKLYAGGGGGAGKGSGGAGGPGGGGAGRTGNGGSGTSSTAFTGGGGGGGGVAPPGGIGGSGGSGIVVVRYQIAASQSGSAKATGGAISFTPSKTVHVFTTSGDFNNTSGSNLSVEYLVIGGGGGGGSRFGGGGGAGAYRTATGFTVSPGPNTVTVGGGGAGGVTKGGPGTEGSGQGSGGGNSVFRP